MLQLIMSDDTNECRFLYFFLTLGGFSLISVPTTWFVSNKKNNSQNDQKDIEET